MNLEILMDLRVARLDGEDVPIGARAFDVLAHLDTHSDRVVSKAELLDAVWPDLTVEESNLSVQCFYTSQAFGERNDQDRARHWLSLDVSRIHRRSPPGWPTSSH